MPWTKLKNPPISNLDLFKKWANEQNRYRGSRRYKVREHNGDIYVKCKNDDGTLEKFWFKKWPENSVIIPTKVFYKDSYLKNPSHHLLGEYIWADDFHGKENIKDWFIENLGSEWECVDRVYTDEKLWVEELIIGPRTNRIINIFETVFVFIFKSKSDAIKYKLIYGC
jgi:hypothetical protein